MFFILSSSTEDNKVLSLREHLHTHETFIVDHIIRGFFS